MKNARTDFVFHFFRVWYEHLTTHGMNCQETYVQGGNNADRFKTSLCYNAVDSNHCDSHFLILICFKNKICNSSLKNACMKKCLFHCPFFKPVTSKR